MCSARSSRPSTSTTSSRVRMVLFPVRFFLGLRRAGALRLRAAVRLLFDALPPDVLLPVRAAGFAALLCPRVLSAGRAAFRAPHCSRKLSASR